MENIIKKLQQGKKAGIIGIFLILAFIAGNSTGLSQNHVVSQRVLGVTKHILPSPTSTPTPTTAPIIVINNIIMPTQAPVVLVTIPIPTSVPPTPTPTISLQPTQVISPTPTPSPMPVPTITLTPTPTQASQTITIAIDYAGAHAASTYTLSITPGETAWQAVQEAVGLANLQDTDYGGSLGIFITGFNGVIANANQYYDFQVNGTSASVGVSSYTVVDHDALKFVLTSF